MEDGWLDGASAAVPPRVGSSEDPNVIFLTSGSTGVSKGAMLSHRAGVAARHRSATRKVARRDAAARS